MLRELQIAEALKRMVALNLHENTVDEFKIEGKLNLSENGGLLFWLNDKQKKIVTKFEAETHNLVYHVIHSYAEFGELYTLLYVSVHEEEWECDLRDIKEGMCLAYVKNIDSDIFSEYGYIGFEMKIGGLVRVA